MDRRASAKCALLAIACLGCGGSDRAGVTGAVVRHDGTPLVGARVTARSNTTGKWASGLTDENGRYVLGTVEAGDGIPPGEYYVKIVEDRGAWDSPRPRTIPSKYEDAQGSGLQLNVEASEQTVLDVKLDPL